MSTPRMRHAALATLAVALAIVPASAVAQEGGTPTDADLAANGRFLPAFQEAGDTCIVDADGREFCQPAGVTVVNLATGRVLFWDALEGTEDVDLNIVAEAGARVPNSRTRILDVSGGVPSFRAPSPEDGGAAAVGGEHLPFPVLDPINSDGDLFCSDQVQLSDGRLIAVGGTDWYLDPYLGTVNGIDYGVSELEGLRATRIFDPYTETWAQSGSMHYARWYPSLVTLPSGDLFVASGVGKLLKPVYPDRPLDSGRNVVQTETFDVATGEWTLNPATANRSLPLYPRLHLLPNGHVYYDVGGQVFNPMGQAYDEAFWNIAASYDPEKQRWNDLGVPGLPGLGLPDLPGIANDDLGGIPLLDELPADGLPATTGSLQLGAGFRGSAFSLMLPLEPNDDGTYTRAEFLSAGGILLPSPGSYLGTNASRVNTVSIDPATGVESLSSRTTGSLNHNRWYGTGVLLPTGEVITFSGSDRDEVLLPGTGQPVMVPELFDPVTENWRPVARQSRPRTYHNTAMLLPDGRVLVGGHSPISTLYAWNTTLPYSTPNDQRDPSFEIYEPPYLFRGDRPSVTAAPRSLATGSTFTITLGDEASAAAVADGGSVVLMRNTAMTHLVDSDQRSVVLPILSRDGATLEVAAPPDRAVAPAGPYNLFVNRPTDDGLVPSVGWQLFVDAPVPPALGGQLPATVPGRDASPVVTLDPAAVLVENLQEALGTPPPATGTAAVAAAPLSSSRPSTGPRPMGWVPPLALLVNLVVLAATARVAGRSTVRRWSG